MISENEGQNGAGRATWDGGKPHGALDWEE